MINFYEFLDKYHAKDRTEIHRIYLEGNMTKNDMEDFETLFMTQDYILAVKTDMVLEKLNRIEERLGKKK